MDVLMNRWHQGSDCPTEGIVLSRKQPADMFYCVTNGLDPFPIKGSGFDPEFMASYVDPPDGRPPVQDEQIEVPDGCVNHTVYPGETMADVARMYGVTVETILKQNGLRIDEQIVEGTQLVVPVTD